MGSTNNTLNATPKKLGRLDKVIVFNVLITAMVLICVSLDVLCQELRWLTFLEGVFKLTPISCVTLYFVTLTPFQNAKYPLICFAAGKGSA
jgi:hypothetical protein